ncbi:zinc finger MYM-type protein 1-like [Hydra vulgaris]|uniref:Zinc finger MYM-type protein 1-like n=1 Tax=Hydra vulgaris TaxID=6087 RepID=A0ABM4CRU2_HYDVU
MSNRTYQSGAAKRKKATKAKEDISKYLPLTSFLLVQKSKPVVSEDVFLCPTSNFVSIDSALLPNETLEIQQELEPEQEPEPEQKPEPEQESEPAQVPEPVQESEPAQEPESNQIKTYPNAITKTTQFLLLRLDKRELHNGEFVNREWLLYSPSTGSVFCFAYTLFSSKHSNFSTTGLDDWKNALKCISGHENGSEHHKNMLTYSSRQRESGQLDSVLLKQLHNEQLYWQNVLKRIVAVVKFLSSRGLPFRGNNETIGSEQNGNYLETLELLSQFDPFLHEHMKKHGNSGKGNTSYLSANICEEFICLMGNKVMSEIISELKKAKYYSISVDSTPDLSHVDQLTFTVRYVKDLAPVERFLQFVPIHGHGAEHLETVILNFLQENEISISDCRGQSYDNASNMAGHYSGLKKRIKDKSESALFIPCAGHSLNLLSGTRWSARADAVTCLHDSYDEIKKALEFLIKDISQSKETQNDAQNLITKMNTFEIVFLTIFWNDILCHFNETSKILQKENLNLDVAVRILKSLLHFIKDLRSQFENYQEKAKILLPNTDYRDSSKRTKKRSRRMAFFDGEAEELEFQGSYKFKIETYLPVIDSLTSNLEKRTSAYEKINDNFGFLVNIQTIANVELKDHCSNLAQIYKKDINENELFFECQQFKYYISKDEHSFTEFYSTLKRDHLESTFPNIEISLRIFLSMMVSNCTGERSFSKLRLIKNELRSTMLQERLN